MYKVYDNLLPKKFVDDICDYVCAPSFIWYLGPSGRTINEEKAKKHPKFKNSTQLTHPFLSAKHPWVKTGIKEFYVPNKSIAIKESNMINSLIIEFYKQLGESCTNKRLHRIKANMLLESTDNTPNPPHIDIIDMDHKVILLYANDSDGDTIIYEDEYGEKVLDKITPKKGRILFFDGHHYHSSTPPVKSQRRIVVNINIIEVNN